MAKQPNLTNITSPYGSKDVINTNSTEIQEAFLNTLSRDGSSPNNMQADLDLDSNDILNVGTLEVIDEITLAGVTLSPLLFAAEEANDAAAAAAASAVIAVDAAEEAVAAQNTMLKPKGNWAPTTAYTFGDNVFVTVAQDAVNGGSSYYCVTPHTSGATFAPDLAKWNLTSQRGAAGAGSGDMLKTENLSGLANYATARTNMGLAIGTNVHPYDANLTTLSGLTSDIQEALTRKKHVIFATGQSNIANHLAYSWTPAANCFLWDFDGLVDAATVVGTTFDPMPNNQMGYGYSYANEVARANPDWDVYLINIGISAMPISKWMTGGPTPDLYDCCKDNVEAALTVLGVSEINEMLWWQGESDYTSNTYAANFETVHARFKAETWFREATPVAMATLTQNGVPSVSHMNSIIKTLVQAQPATRSLVDIGGQLSAQSWWTATDYLHLSAVGYEEAGKIAFNTLKGNGVLSSAQWRTVNKPSTTVRTSTTTLADDPHLTFPMKNGRSYTVRGRVFGYSEATPDFKWGLVGPTGTTIVTFATVMKNDTITTLVGRGSSGYFTGETVLQGSNGTLSIEFTAQILPATADGTFAFQWSQNTSNAGPTAVWGGSYIDYIEFG